MSKTTKTKANNHSVQKPSNPPVQNQSQPSRLASCWGWCCCVAALVAVFCLLLAFESDYLLRVQELNLFLYTPLFFKQQMVVAGGMLTYLGTYFTQYFYYPWVGSLILCLWLGLMMWLMARAFQLPHKWAPLLLLPVALILLTDFNLGYWLYYLKLRGHFFITVMGTSLAVALVWAYRVVPARYTFMVLAAIVAYPVAGFYGLLAVLLMGIITWRLPGLSLGQRILHTLMAVVLLIAVPYIYYRQVYYQTNSDFIWWQALPLYPDSESLSPYYYIYILLVVFLTVLAALYRVRFSLSWLQKPWQQVSMQMLCIAVIAWGCWHFWYKDASFHEELRMEACIDRCDWEGVLSIMREHDGEPTRMMVMNKNLALFKLGRAGDEMYNYPDGSRKVDSPFEVRMAQYGGKNIYLHYGLPNYCYRWCLEDGVEYGWRAVYLKFLVRCALLNDEWQVAKKYIDLLKQTRFHRQWAEQYEPLARPRYETTVQAMDTQMVCKPTTLIDVHPELGPIRQIMSDGDVLGSDQSLVELFLLNLQASRITNDLKCAELVLLSALQMKDIPMFWRAFFQYATLKKDNRIPRHFQEAAFLYGNLEHNVDISHMPFDPSVPASYQEFMRTAQQYQGMTEEQLKVVMRSRFGNTFYYNYFLMRNMKTY